ncbi:MAG: recombinase family protein [Desulfofustis sp. PB-SRB1]|jgi:DNA invertase Pin-like site-specific DNA recombinase|nr:recombinase family protein [Desulfofustis sp. PB-SRB1]MBL0382065.1 recombinase family protein [Desulfofustis sp. PB-SRB1]MBM1004082.1 recombinase family protein [Desulfofustis sp. PB-SRB1]
MIDTNKIQPTHLQRQAFVYVRQSTASQVEYNKESTQRQYQLKDRAIELGWPHQRVKIIDEDLAQSGADSMHRTGFTMMTSEVALGRVGLLLSLEVSRVARNNSDWYRLLDLCSVTNTLIGDGDGLYHPGLFNDRLLLGMKGTMAEAELHVIRARLDGGIRNKAARGELRRGLPVGFVWGEQDGEVLMHPDQAVCGAIQTIFDKFPQVGSARQVWLWFRSQQLLFPLQSSMAPEIQWVTPSYHAIHSVLTNPTYAGVYTYGKTKQDRFVDANGQVKKRVKRKPRSQWSVFIHDHHEGYIDWETYEMIQERLAKNTRPISHHESGAVREGTALLQGIATCGNCGRRLKVYYQGRNCSPGYYCPANKLMEGRGKFCMRVGGVALDAAVADAFLEAISPAAAEAALLAEKNIEAEHDRAIEQWRLQLERFRYEAERAERRFKAVEPENRLVARSLERQWEQSLKALEDAEKDFEQRKRRYPKTLTQEQKALVQILSGDLQKVWYAPTITSRDKKELLQVVLQEVNITVDRTNDIAHLLVRWKTEAVLKIDVPLPRRSAPPIRTKQDTIDLVRRLAEYYTDAIIAGILNRQERRTAGGLEFTANRVGNLRRYWNIPNFDGNKPGDGELVTIQKAAEILELAPSTLHRWLSDGFIGGEQITPGAPWQIRITDELRSKFMEHPPEGYATMKEAKSILGVSRQTILNRLKTGKLSAVHVRKGKQLGLYIKVSNKQLKLI